MAAREEVTQLGEVGGALRTGCSPHTSAQRQVSGLLCWNYNELKTQSGRQQGPKHPLPQEVGPALIPCRSKIPTLAYRTSSAFTPCPETVPEATPPPKVGGGWRKGRGSPKLLASLPPAHPSQEPPEAADVTTRTPSLSVCGCWRRKGQSLSSSQTAAWDLPSS